MVLGRRSVPFWGLFCNLERQVSYFFGNFTPKTRNYCLKNRALGFPGRSYLFLLIFDSLFRAGVSPRTTSERCVCVYEWKHLHIFGSTDFFHSAQTGLSSKGLYTNPRKGYGAKSTPKRRVDSTYLGVPKAWCTVRRQ